MLDEQIDENLRRVYGATLNQPLPDKFTQLLEQLRQQQKAQTETPSGDDE